MLNKRIEGLPYGNPTEKDNHFRGNVFSEPSTFGK